MEYKQSSRDTVNIKQNPVLYMRSGCGSFLVSDSKAHAKQTKVGRELKCSSDESRVVKFFMPAGFRFSFAIDIYVFEAASIPQFVLFYVFLGLAGCICFY